MTTLIIGGTRQAACAKLCQIHPGPIQSREHYDEANINGHRILALGGSPDDLCWLIAAGFNIEIVTVEPNLVSPEMWGRIRHVRSAARG